MVYHVLNRGNARRTMFDAASDYSAFERILVEVAGRIPIRILAWCLLPNHWHLVLWPRENDHLSAYLRLVTLTHTQRWHAHRGTAGTGHLYQGRFKSFVVQADGHFLNVCRYVEANALRAGLVKRAEDWRWCSLHRRLAGASLIGDEPWPVHRPQDWLALVNEAFPSVEVARIRNCAQRGTPRAPLS
jgi:putative transposase